MNHWKNIANQVTQIALPILPYIRTKKLKSEILSNLFESQSEKYFNSINIPVRSASYDREPDLYFIAEERPLEIKVTGSDHPLAKKLKWMGGKYSKRTSDYVFIAWNHNEQNNEIKYFIAEKYVNESEWKTMDNGKENYYATLYSTEELLKESYEVHMGEYRENTVYFE